jgi:predicted HTH domain antitoxin
MKLTVDIPSQVDAREFDLKMCLASKLYEDGRASLGIAAKVAGLSKRAFIEMLGNYNVSLFQQTEEDINEDVRTFEQLCHK